MPNSDYDVFKKTDMEDTVQLMEEVLRKGRHGHLFGFELHFGKWYKKFRNITDPVQKPGKMREMWMKRGPWRCSRLKRLLRRALGPLHTTGPPPTYSRLFHMNVSKSALHFWRLGRYKPDRLRLMDYGVGGERVASIQGGQPITATSVGCPGRRSC